MIRDVLEKATRNALQAMLQKQKVREIMADRTVTDVMDKMGLNRSGSATEQHRFEIVGV